MNIPQLIQKKRDKEELSEEEIFTFVQLLVSKQVEHVQLGAFLMALYLNGLSPKESAALTSAMTLSGDTLSWPEDWKPILVDKHSTGGVGDKISLILAPALAACGLKVPMVSGRSLGFTGGTLDKLESIPGFTVALTTDQMKQALEVAGCFIAGQTETLVPADRIMYAARDVTATVERLELITASIISKKAAENISALVLDVKVGNAAFMKSVEQARELARMMVQVATKQKIKTVAVLTKMENPIGKSIGNALEVEEALQTLKGQGPRDILELVLIQGSTLLQLSGVVSNLEEGELMIKKAINNGSALAKFQHMLEMQGVEAEIAKKLCFEDTWSVLPKAIYITPLQARLAGWITGIDALLLARISGTLGASRMRASDNILHSVGIKILVDLNQQLDEGQVWGEVHHDTPLTPAILDSLCNAITISDKPVPLLESLVLEIIQHQPEQ